MRNYGGPIPHQIVPAPDPKWEAVREMWAAEDEERERLAELERLDQHMKDHPVIPLPGYESDVMAVDPEASEVKPEVKPSEPRPETPFRGPYRYIAPRSILKEY